MFGVRVSCPFSTPESFGAYYEGEVENNCDSIYRPTVPAELSISKRLNHLT